MQKNIAVSPEVYAKVEALAAERHWTRGYTIEWLYNFYARQPKLDAPISNLDEQKDEAES
jgi:hypothetical protein